MENQVTQFSISDQIEPQKSSALDHIVEASANDYKALDITPVTDTVEEEPKKKKRGRPSIKSLNNSIQTPSSSVKRSRGRPSGSGNLQILASYGGEIAETAGGNFTPHVVTVNPGEDVVDRISAFSHSCPRAVCILSATGAVSSVVIGKPGSLNGSLRYQGNFEILSLSGSYAFGGDDAHCKKGKLTISLAEPGGTVFGGVLVGSMIAAIPIQLILASFKQNISKEIKRRNSAGPSSSAPNMSSSLDSERVPLNVSRMIEEERSFPSPKCGLLPTKTDRLPENSIPATTTGVSDNVDVPANQNMHSVSLNGFGNDRQDLQSITDQRKISVDEDASVQFSSGQLE